VHSTLDII